MGAEQSGRYGHCNARCDHIQKMRAGVRPMFLVTYVGRIMDAASTRKCRARRIHDASQRHLQPYAPIPGTHPAGSQGFVGQIIAW